MRYLTDSEIALRAPDPGPASRQQSWAQARATMARLGLSSPNQQMGQRWPIGCVAIEITQRCNLDCSLCYLSESSEAVKDLPLEAVLRRIDQVFSFYGPHTDVQVTGGEPTLRKREELHAIVRRIHALGMRATLMTNGIRASRSLLEELSDAGLVDVVFHVDTTQQRKGLRTEVELNAVRQEYIDRAAALPLSVMFNTTVHDGNFDEIPAVVEFFKAQAGRVRSASFPLQADIGRGVQRTRKRLITPDSVARQIEVGAGIRINFAASLVGHPSCNRYGMCLQANSALYDAFGDADFVARMQRASVGLVFDRRRATVAAAQFLTWLLRHPTYWVATLRWLMNRAWEMKVDLLRGGGRVRTLSFVIHNFMDGTRLEPERIEACVFKVMSDDGPISMCLHNAKRDSFILHPIRIHRGTASAFWNPITGAESTEQTTLAKPDFSDRSRRLLKERARRAAADHGAAIHIATDSRIPEGNSHERSRATPRSADSGAPVGHASAICAGHDE